MGRSLLQKCTGSTWEGRRQGLLGPVLVLTRGLCFMHRPQPLCLVTRGCFVAGGPGLG